MVKRSFSLDCCQRKLRKVVTNTSHAGIKTAGIKVFSLQISPSVLILEIFRTETMIPNWFKKTPYGEFLSGKPLKEGAK